jgi:amino acid transporter
MDKQKILTIILSIINIAWLLFSLIVLLQEGSELIIMFLPLVIGLITFVILKKIRKFETIRALKYSNIAFIIPVGIMLGLYFLFYNPIMRTAGSDVINPAHEQCYQLCQNKTQEFINATKNCIKTCLENLKNK